VVHGQFVVDDTIAPTAIRITVPDKNAEGNSKDKLDPLGGHVVACPKNRGRRFASVNKFADWLRADGFQFSQNDLPALIRLPDHGQIEWPEAPERRPRPGWLTDSDDDDA
jgi:hypothetical protein